MKVKEVLKDFLVGKKFSGSMEIYYSPTCNKIHSDETMFIESVDKDETDSNSLILTGSVIGGQYNAMEGSVSFNINSNLNLVI